MTDSLRPLQWSYVQLDEINFCRTPILLSGEEELLLVDGGFTLSSGRLLVDKIKASGKRLSTIFVTCDDPDYYFGLGPVVDAFPHARVLATPGTTQRILDTVAHKIEVWKAKIGDECPQRAADVRIPAPYGDSQLALEGATIEIQTAAQRNRYHLWVDSLKAVLGGVQVVSGIHVWMADAPAVEERASWLQSLRDMLAQQPSDVLPGHMTAGSPTGVKSIQFTIDYIETFNRELLKAGNSAELIAEMKGIYPTLGLGFVLELGAKVCKGEVVWP